MVSEEEFDGKGEIVEGKRKRKSSSEKKKRSARKSKDKNKPKNARNAYQYFFKDMQQNEEVKKLPLAERSKRIGELWKQLSDKSTYEEQAKEDQVRYAKEMEDYVPAEGDEKKTRRTKEKKDPNAPKGAKSAYLFFQERRRAEIKQAGEAVVRIKKLQQKNNKFFF